MTRAAAASDRNDVEATWDYVSTLAYPNADVGGSANADYSPTIYKYDMANATEAWQHELGTTEGQTFITAWKVDSPSNKLVVAGSTTGYGETIGGSDNSGDKWDGFVSVANTETGVIDTTDTGLYTARIRSHADRDDKVLGACISNDSVFLVGSTTVKITGETPGGAFVVKMNLDTLTVV